MGRALDVVLGTAAAMVAYDNMMATQRNIEARRRNAEALQENMQSMQALQGRMGPAGGSQLAKVLRSAELMQDSLSGFDGRQME